MKTLKKILGMFVLSLPVAVVIGATAAVVNGLKIGLLAAVGASLFVVLFGVCIVVGTQLIDKNS